MNQDPSIKIPYALCYALRTNFITLHKNYWRRLTNNATKLFEKKQEEKRIAEKKKKEEDKKRIALKKLK